MLCGLYLVDALVYLAPLVLAASLAFVELTTSAWVLFGVTVVGNLGLAGPSLLIIVRTPPAAGRGAAAGNDDRPRRTAGSACGPSTTWQPDQTRPHSGPASSTPAAGVRAD